MAELTVTFTQLQNRLRERMEISPNLTRIATLGTWGASGAISTTVADGTTLAAGSVMENATTGEQVLVATVSTNTVTALAEGRGYRGTTAAAGTANDTLYVNPRFSTDNIKAAINVVYNDWCSWFFPRLLWDTGTAGTFISTSEYYASPANALSIENLSYIPDRRYAADVALTEYGPLRQLPSALVSTEKGFRLRSGGPTSRTVADGSISASSTTLTSATAAFTSGDVGTDVSISGAGAAGVTLYTYISAYTSATQVTVATAASTTSGTATLYIGPQLLQQNKVRWTFLESGSDTVPSDFPGEGVDLILDGAALYLAGWKTIPHFTPTEAVFHRDAQTDQSPLSALAIKAREWSRRAKEVAGSYNSLAGGASPARVWI